MKVDGAAPVDTPCGREGSKGSEGKVLKMDGPSAQGFLSLTGPSAPRVVVAAPPQLFMPPAAAKAENHTTGPGARWKCTPSACGISPGGQCYSVKRFTQAYVITTCAFFVCKKKLRFTKKYKNIKKRLDKSSKI